MDNHESIPKSRNNDQDAATVAYSAERDTESHANVNKQQGSCKGGSSNVPPAAALKDGDAAPTQQSGSTTAAESLQELIRVWTGEGLPVLCNPRRLETPDLDAIAEQLDVPKAELYAGRPLRAVLNEAVITLGVGPHIDFGALPRTDVTYRQLMAEAKAVTTTQASKSSWNTYTANLRSYMGWCDKTEDDVVGTELSTDFDVKTSEWLNDELPDSIQKTENIRKKRFTVRVFARAYTALQHRDGLPGSFAPALDVLFKLPGVLPNHLAKHAGISVATLQGWRSGSRALHDQQDKDAVAKIEKYFRLPPGILTNLVTVNPHKRRSYCPTPLFPPEYRQNTNAQNKLRKRVRRMLPADFEALPTTSKKEELVAQKVREFLGASKIKHRERLAILRARPYRLHLEDWPAQLRAEWEGTPDSLKVFKSSDVPVRGMKRTSTWATAGTVKKNLDSYAMFFGWLMLDKDNEDSYLRGCGMAQEELTFALFLDTELVEAFTQFRILRAGALTKSATNYFPEIAHLLSRDGGWLRQRPDLLARVKERFSSGYSLPQDDDLPSQRPATPKTIKRYQDAIKVWDDLCDEAHDRYREVDRSYTGPDAVTPVGRNRDPFEPIFPLLRPEGDPKDAPLPEEYLDKMHELMRQDFGDLSTHRQYRLYQQYMLSRLLTHQPLRLNHWVILDYLEDNTGRLRRGTDEATGAVQYTLHFEREDFKNRRSKLFGTVTEPRSTTIVLPSDLSEEMEHFMVHCRPMLLREHTHSRVFCANSGAPATGHTLYGATSRATAKYLGEHGSGLRIKGVHSFGTHAYRHIKATTVLRLTGSFDDVANILLDAVDTVRATYTLFSPGDLAERSRDRADDAKARFIADRAAREQNKL